MNYPIQGLTVIAPIIFLVLMIGIPVIGVFAGWKRAAYWGGGTFVFFVIGLIIWSTAGAQIVSGLKSTITNLIQSLAKGVTITDSLLVSVTAPIFFILVMMVAELLLLINYYAWFKRVSGIRDDVRAKKYAKAVKKHDSEKIAKYKAYAKPQGSWRQMQFTTAGKAINMACGGAGMALLFAPSTISFTQAVLYMTTSAETRANASFTNSLYNSLQNTNSAFSWMSYYGNGNTAKDYDSLFSMIALTTTKISYTYTDANGNQQTVTDGTVTEAMVNIVSGNLGNVVKQTTTASEDPVEAANDAIDQFVDQWNGLISSNETSITTVFQSENVTEVLKSVIGENVTSKQTLTEDQIKNGYLNDDSVFNQVYEQYLEREPEEQLQKITISETSYNNIAESVTAIFDTTGVSEDIQKQFNEKISEMVGLMFTYPNQYE